MMIIFRPEQRLRGAVMVEESTPVLLLVAEKTAPLDEEPLDLQLGGEIAELDPVHVHHNGVTLRNGVIWKPCVLKSSVLPAL